MEPLEERIAQLEEKFREQERVVREQLIARQKSQEAREERTRDTRRETLVGSAILGAIKTGEWPRDKLLALLDRKLLRSEDRALFKLPPLELSEETGPDEISKEPGNF